MLLAIGAVCIALLIFGAMVWRDSILRSTSTFFDAKLHTGFFWEISRASWPLLAVLGAIPFVVVAIVSRAFSVGRFVVALGLSALMLGAVPASTFLATRSEHSVADPTPTDLGADQRADQSSGAPSIAESPAPTTAPSDASESASSGSLASGPGAVLIDPVRPGAAGAASGSSTPQSQNGAGGQSQSQSSTRQGQGP